MNKYEGPIFVGQVFTAPDNDGVLGFRRVRVLAEHPDGGLIIEDLVSRCRKAGYLHQPNRMPEFSLRVVFVPEEPDGDHA